MKKLTNDAGRCGIGKSHDHLDVSCELKIHGWCTLKKIFLIDIYFELSCGRLNNVAIKVKL